MTAKPPKTLNTAQQEELLTALQNKSAPLKTFLKGVRNYLMATLMLEAGLRVGEVVKMRISHLYFNGSPVKTLVLHPSVTKNHKERTVPVSAALEEALLNFRDHWIDAGKINSHGFCFYTKDPTKPVTTRQVENILNAASMKSLGRNINPHMLRHTFASKLMRVTGMRTVQELLGHSYITSTQIYTHPNEDDKVAAIEAVGNNAQ